MMKCKFKEIIQLDSTTNNVKGRKVKLLSNICPDDTDDDDEENKDASFLSILLSIKLCVRRISLHDVSLLIVS